VPLKYSVPLSIAEYHCNSSLFLSELVIAFYFFVPLIIYHGDLVSLAFIIVINVKTLNNNSNIFFIFFLKKLLIKFIYQWFL
jgi:hypothetical protein